MPLAFDKDATTPIWLESDANKPIETRPVFLARFLTRREMRKFRETLTQRSAEIDALNKARQDGTPLPRVDGDAVFADIVGVIRACITGWRNMIGPDGVAIPFDGDFDAVLSEYSEFWELAYACLNKPRADAEDKKK